MVPALRGLNFTVPAGEICIVRGANGSGKSTLVEILAGALKPSAGEVTVDGTIRLVRQFGNVLPELTVREYLDLSGHNADVIVSQWDLADLEHLRMSQVSRGTSQLIAIAAVLAAHPSILLADEPAASLSVAESQVLYRRITQHCRANNITLVLVTHDVAAEQFADRVVRLSDGRMSEQWLPGAPEKSIIDRHGWLRLARDSGIKLPSVTRFQTSGADLVLTELERQADQVARSNREKPSNKVMVRTRELTAGFSTTPVIKACSIDISQNSLTAITGPAGSGKTTFLQTLVGQVRVSSGTFDVFGKISLFSDHVGEHLSVREAGAYDDFVKSLGIESYADRPMNKLSGGQRQKALLALALSSTAEILLIDDPTNSLDEENRELVCRVLLAQQGRTIVVSTNDMILIDVCDQAFDLAKK